MAGFDEGGLYYSEDLRGEENNEADNNVLVITRKFQEFLREFHEGNFVYKYRQQIDSNCDTRQYWIEVSIEDISSYDEDLANRVLKQPSETLPLLETAAKEVAEEIRKHRTDVEEFIQDIQVVLTTESNPISLRNLKSDYISKLVRVPGIVISASSVKAKATSITLQCRGCREVMSNIQVKPGLEGFLLPRKCNTEQAGRSIRCPLDPFFIVPDKCRCADFQTLKLQEAPEAVPQGEMPRHLLLYCDRYLCERAVPGNRITVLGVYSIKKVAKAPRNGMKDSKASAGIRSPYLRVVGIQIETENSGHSNNTTFTPEEEESFRYLASSPNVFDRIAKSIAPSIYGFEDIKKAVACLLFSGSRKRLPDGLTRRGDINVLLLGDPGTAKSQVLKFVQKVAPIAVYTSGKGSSAAGLTASVVRDPSSRNFIMEGGAMVLADGGCVCIDEFDKMREDDRVAIHEAMEQQTISIAKAGITTTLNSRCAVLAAANSVFGRWDDAKAEQNIDFMPTILARFDMIFIVKDEHNERRDAVLARHVMDVHMNAQRTVEDSREGELSLNFLRKYIDFCRKKCGPRLSAVAAQKLSESYVTMRNGARDHEEHSRKKSAIPITVRQLEAIIRVSESLAKMELKPFADIKHVQEAIRLFSVSTLKAAQSGDLAGAEGFTTEEEQKNLLRIEKQIKRRFPVGTQISVQSITNDMMGQGISERSVQRVLHCMIRRGEIQFRMGRKMLYRLK